MSEYKSMDTNEITKAYMDSILIEERLIDSSLPSTEFDFLGETFSGPIMMPAFSHLPAYNGRGKSGLVEYSEAAQSLNIVNWCGMMENDTFFEILKTGARTVRIVKPYADKAKVMDQIAFAQENGALAVGVDIDHVFGAGGYDVVAGEAMTAQSLDDIKSYVNATVLPFVVKGVLSVQDAVKCAEAGVKAVVVSHHHGILPFAVPPMMVLPKIKKALEGTGVSIVVDCGIDRGVDAYKALALGADAVSVGRAMLPPLEKQGSEGVMQYVRSMNQELIKVMGFTGAKTLDKIEPSTLWIDGKQLLSRD